MSLSVRQAACPATFTNFGVSATKNYHMEYGYSCMGYEIDGGLGVKTDYYDGVPGYET